MKIGIETLMMIQIREWVIQKTELGQSFFHFANEGKTSWIGGKLLKQMGVVSGVLDIFMSKSNDFYSGLWIEIKKPGEKPTKAQLKFMQDRINEGYYATWFDDVDNTIAFIKQFYHLN